MPNWCSNVLGISGDKKDIFNLFRDVGFKDRNIKQLENFLEKKSNKSNFLVSNT